jgi:hypothetical protein
MLLPHHTQVKPVRPESPKLLPLVHQLWPHLLAALKDPRTPLVERALALLSQLTLAAGGQFMVRRIKLVSGACLGGQLLGGAAGWLCAAMAVCCAST